MEHLSETRDPYNLATYSPYYAVLIEWGYIFSRVLYPPSIGRTDFLLVQVNTEVFLAATRASL